MKSKIYIGEVNGVCFLSTEYKANGRKLLESIIVMAFPEKKLYKLGRAYDPTIHSEELIKDFIKDIIWDAE